ncbi:TadE/TadG family type IV pilus assembly protein [Methylorubrum zatmanii]|uniref:TadE/TadG family type IV pilus assembly protein n=1 Tax=Methylorubrum zatmanii TaxID=29429 RepID=A0ABW1WMZ3_9HYPH
MTPRFITDRKGSTTVEFAFVAPLLVLIFIGFVLLLYAIWIWNALGQVATETARCVAVGSGACTKPASGCASQDAAICFLLTLAAQRGMTGLRPDLVTIDTQSVRGGRSFTSVLVTYPFPVLRQTVTIKASGDFPNLR